MKISESLLTLMEEQDDLMYKIGNNGFWYRLALMYKGNRNHYKKLLKRAKSEDEITRCKTMINFFNSEYKKAIEEAKEAEKNQKIMQKKLNAVNIKIKHYFD